MHRPDLAGARAPGLPVAKRERHHLMGVLADNVSRMGRPQPLDGDAGCLDDAREGFGLWSA
jgi:hypothetical protein